jgi:hypothetical protein
VLTRHTETVNALQSAQVQIIKEKNTSETVSKRFSELQEQKTTIDTSMREERVKSENLQKENESLKVNLQAKKDAEAQAAQAAVTPQPVAPVAVAGDCGSWLAAAGVSDTSSAMALIGRESGCNPNAVNPSSGACGVAQELPCGKSGCSLGDGACQVRWMNSYVSGRYGSWANALGHSYSVGWY